MRRVLSTTALVAALCAMSPVWAQEEQPLVQMIEEALEQPDADIGQAEPERFSADELDALLAPVALYPDALLAQVLVAATFPLQIVRADRILAAGDAQSDDELAEAIEAYEWDPSVLVLLSGFPDVIRRMAVDLDETERLGVAMAQQDADVLESVQRLRLQAEESGYLTSNAAQLVEREADRIVIEPADPEIVYVPRYDPARAYTSAPTAAPVIQAPGSGFGLDNPLVAGGIAFGSALLVNELFGDDSDDGDGDGWDDYWRRDRQAIDWRENQVYPRAYAWDDDARRREAAWARERDQNWDRDARRWRREADDARRAEWRERRAARAWEVRRDREDGIARVRLQDWNDARSPIERRSEAEAERDRLRARARAAERREAAVERERRIERREERAEDRAEEAAKARRREAAAEREDRARRAERADDRAKAAREANEAKEAKAARAAAREANEAKEAKAARAAAREADEAKEAKAARAAAREANEAKEAKAARAAAREANEAKEAKAARAAAREAKEAKEAKAARAAAREAKEAKEAKAARAAAREAKEAKEAKAARAAAREANEAKEAKAARAAAREANEAKEAKAARAAARQAKEAKEAKAARAAERKASQPAEGRAERRARRNRECGEGENARRNCN